MLFNVPILPFQISEFALVDFVRLVTAEGDSLVLVLEEAIV